MSELGCAVTALENNSFDLGFLDSTAIDLVFLDAELPGNAAAQLLDQNSPLSQVPVVILAASEGEIDRYLAMGAQDYLVAPLKASLVKARAKTLLEVSQLRRNEISQARETELTKIEHDIQIVRNIQKSFLPEELPTIPGWEITSRFHPAREVAGDFYDAFFLTQNRRVGFVIADVCDKGVGAALFMALFRSLIRAFAQQHYTLTWMDAISDDFTAPRASTPAERRKGLPSIGTSALKNAIQLTNNYIAKNHDKANMFATLFFGVLDPQTGSLSYVNGGHNPPVLVGSDGKIKAHLKTTGLAVGMLPDVDYKIQTIQIDPGDMLITYTDGVTEAQSASGAFFTDDRLYSLVQQQVGSASEMLDRIEADVQAFTEGAVQSDDITMLAVKRLAE
jgi:sigma-B regulation protein RsbU (phosphoserine phosphatase)